MTLREIVFDVETTGLKTSDGHRIVEIGCIELLNHVPSGQHFHHFFNPGRPMDPGATSVSGITDAMLEDKPDFSERAGAFLDFIGDAPLIAHNASFDMEFVNTELARIGMAELSAERVIDTLTLARRKFPGAPNSLDALCKRFNIDLSEREKHGALIDARLLAEVYIELIGGRQTRLALAGADSAPSAIASKRTPLPPRPRGLTPRITEAERAAHDRFIATLKGDIIWKKT